MKIMEVKNMNEEISQKLTAFLSNCPTAFHAAAQIQKELESHGFLELPENQKWKIQPGGAYYTTRNGSSIIAFRTGTELEDYSFNIAAVHSDSPAFKVKEHAEIEVKNKYVQLNTEGYGGMLCASWFDRPLSVAGRVILREGNRFTARLVNIDRSLVLIPSLSIHLNRSANDGYAYNKQVDLLPLFGGKDVKKGDLLRLIAEELDILQASIYGSDLYLYNREKPVIWGAQNEFISAQRLDDLQCAFAVLLGFLAGCHRHSVNMYACFDSEEIGSATKQGAGSTFLYDVLKRVNTGLGKTDEDYFRAVSASLMLSADNAQALHPNHPEKADPENCVYLNEGVVIKSHAGQKYATDAVSSALFRAVCEEAGVPVQYYANRSDAPSGGTLGNISSAKVPLNTADVGLAQLAMHSAYETAGMKDTYYMMRAAKQFYSAHFSAADGHYCICN